MDYVRQILLIWSTFYYSYFELYLQYGIEQLVNWLLTLSLCTVLSFFVKSRIAYGTVPVQFSTNTTVPGKNTKKNTSCQILSCLKGISFNVNFSFVNFLTNWKKYLNFSKILDKLSYPVVIFLSMVLQFSVLLL